MANQRKVAGGTTRLTQLIRIAIIAASAPMFWSEAALAEFNMSFIHGDENLSNAEAVAQGDALQPGVYPFDIYVNLTQVDHKDVTFRQVKGQTASQPCLKVEDLRNYGIKLPETLQAGSCVDLPALIKDATVSYDAAVQQINISVPQTMMDLSAIGAIPPSMYDEGINALFANYNFNYNKNSYRRSDADDSEYMFLALNSGLNLGRWRLRNNSTWDKQSGSSSNWTNVSSWAETDIVPWRSRLVMGQASTNNSVFNSFQFRGVQLSSVDDMLPDSLRGYAPVVRGVAATNARVEIRQNGYVIYSTNVAPGPFEIHDVYPHTNNGDLQVTVNEADGSHKTFSVAYSSVANMLREGIWNFQLTAGKYHNGNGGYQPKLIQGTAAYGMNYGLTPFGGAIIAEHYRSAAVGIGKSLGSWGAISVDGSISDTELANGDRKQGQSFRFLYSKSLNQMGTNFQLAGYRYATSGYYDLSDAVQERNSWRNGIYANDYWDPNDLQPGQPSWSNNQKRTRYTARYGNKRERVELSLSQQLWAGASLYANVSHQNYWGVSGNDRTIQLGYNDGFKRISYGVYLQDTRGQYGYSDRSVNFTMSIPLDWGQSNNSTTANFSAAHSKQSGDSYSTGISGTMLDDRRMNYSVSTGHTQSSGQSSNLNLGYSSSIGNIDGSYAYSSKYRQEGLGVSGGLLVHSGGATLTQPLQNTILLVEAKDAKGVRLENQPGVTIDRFGYAVVPSANPYRYNYVALRTEDFGPGLDVPVASKQVVPTEKSVVKVSFDTFKGVSLLIHARLGDNGYPAIGAGVFNESGRNSGTVGLEGATYVSGVKAGEKLTIKWGPKADQQCVLPIPADVGDKQAAMGYQELTLQCQKL